MKVTLTLMSLMIAFFFVFTLVSPVYAGEKEKEFKIEKMEVKEVAKEEPVKNKSASDTFFFPDEEFFFAPEEVFFVRPKAFFGPRFFFAPRFFGD